MAAAYRRLRLPPHGRGGVRRCFRAAAHQLALLFIAESFSFLVVSDKLHDCYHIEGHWLERYDWFLQRRERHFQHHWIHKQNLSLGGMDPVFDKLFGSYAEPGSHRKSERLRAK
jgi:hypothetical protein